MGIFDYHCTHLIFNSTHNSLFIISVIFIANESYQPKQVIFFVISEVLGVNIALLVVLEVLLALGPPTYFPRKLISALTGMMGVFSHIRIIGNKPPFWNLVLGIINLLIMVVLNFLFLPVIVEVMWVLVPHTFPTRKLSVGVMVMICVI